MKSIWIKYRSFPIWTQILIALLILSLGAVGNASDQAEANRSPTTAEIEAWQVCVANIDKPVNSFSYSFSKSMCDGLYHVNN